MRIREILYEARIYNQDILDIYLVDYSVNLPIPAQNFMKKLITKLSQDPRNQIKPKLKPDATEWDRKDLANGTLVEFNLLEELANKLDHIHDWLRNPEITEQDLNSLIGIQDIDIAYDHADRFFERLNKKASSDEDESGLETIMTWPDGFKLVKLNTAPCLDREGKLMQHCVGSYADRIESGTEILSLRDPQNNPHVTIEKRGNNIHQIKGKQNEAPIEKYHKYIKDYLNKNKFNNIRDLHNIGLIKVNNKIYELNNLPDNFTVDGGLCLSGFDIKKLPENLTINGRLFIRGCPIKKLPNGLKINGELYASETALESLPDDLEVAEDIDISLTNIKELPKSWNGKTIDGFLNIAYCPIKELSKGLKINSSLYAEKSGLEVLPEDLEVGRNIDISHTKVKELPKSWNGKIIAGHLDISYCPIKKLPENLTINAHLDISYCPIKELPKNLIVNNILNIRNTLITELPDTLDVKYRLYISKDMNLTYVPSHLKKKIVV